MTEPGRSFPLEIFIAVIDRLQEAGDITSLRNCALVCRAFYVICQKSLFSKLVLTRMDPKYVDAPDQQHWRFYELISANPSIAAHVHSLELRLGRLTEKPKQAWPRWHRASTPALLSILHALKHVKHLHVCSSTNSRRSWTEYSPQFVDGLMALSRSPELRSLELRMIDDIPSSFFSAFPTLRQIGVYGIRNLRRTAPNAIDSMRSDSSQRIQLHSVRAVNTTVADVDVMFLGPSSVFDLRSLHVLDVKGVSVDDFAKFLAICSSSIQHLKLDIASLLGHKSSCLQLTTLTALVSLAITVDASRIEFDQSLALALAETLDSVPSCCNLRAISLAFKYVNHVLVRKPSGFQDIITPILRTADTRTSTLSSFETFYVEVGRGIVGTPASLREPLRDLIAETCHLTSLRQMLHVSIL